MAVQSEALTEKLNALSKRRGFICQSELYGGIRRLGLASYDGFPTLPQPQFSSFPEPLVLSRAAPSMGHTCSPILHQALD
jgi:hypothetical protein